MKVTAYKLVKANSDSQFVEDINELIKKGWQPLGPPVMAQYQLVQAMVLYEKESTIWDIFDGTTTSTGPR